MSTHSQPSPTIQKAKRIFLLNLALCFLLGSVLLISHFKQPNETATQTETVTPTVEPQLSKTEYMNLQGQVLGLAEDSRITPPYKDKQLIHYAQDILKQIDHPTTDDPQPLIAAYIEGYHNRFEDYYSEQAGYDAGYHCGLQIDPTRYPKKLPEILILLLDQDKHKSPNKYPLDHAEWIIFKMGYTKGYESGYIQTKEGITQGVIHSLEL